jgi:hypothetical protein
MSTPTAKIALSKTLLLSDVATTNANLDAIDAAVAGGVALAADGAIAILMGSGMITKGSAAALTLAAPTATTDDYKVLRIASTTAFAHVITCPQGFNGKGASGTATFAASKGSSVTLVAYQGQWYVSANVGATLA